jgi:four helix bundle protein
VSIDRFEDLNAWQKARRLVQTIYRLTKKRTFTEDRGLSWQIRDASVSVMGNIAEAHARYSFEDKRRLLDVSLGSSKEVQSHLYVALDQTYIDREEFDGAYQEAGEAGKLVNGMINNLDDQIGRRSAGKSGPRRKPQ